MSRIIPRMAELLLEAMQALQPFGSPKDTGGAGGAGTEQLQLRGPHSTGSQPFLHVHQGCSIARGKVSDPAVPMAAPGFGDSSGEDFSRYPN